jgi:hypothetical protein
MPSQARKALGANEGKRGLYTCELIRIGSKPGYKDNNVTILWKDVKDETGQIVADHLWSNMTKGFKQADLKPGDLVEFRATVEKYDKGYQGRQEDVFDKPMKTDYRLSRPTNIRKLEK